VILKKKNVWGSQNKLLRFNDECKFEASLALWEKCEKRDAFDEILF
jgi:hypothetical protein